MVELEVDSYLGLMQLFSCVSEMRYTQLMGNDHALPYFGAEQSFPGGKDSRHPTLSGTYPGRSQMPTHIVPLSGRLLVRLYEPATGDISSTSPSIRTRTRRLWLERRPE